MTHVLGVEVQPTVEKEPVMDVAAIDMTDAVAASQKPPTPPRRKKGKRATSARRQPAKTATAKAQPKRTRDGSVGRDTFQRVEALVKTGKTKSAAFKQVAKDTGRNEGTVSANYYRVARTSGAVTPRQGPSQVCACASRAAASAGRSELQERTWCPDWQQGRRPGSDRRSACRQCEGAGRCRKGAGCPNAGASRSAGGRARSAGVATLPSSAPVKQ